MPPSETWNDGGGQSRGRNEKRNKKIAEINAPIATLDDGKSVPYKDIGKEFLDRDGRLAGEIISANLHLSARGYDIWGNAIKGDLEKLVR